MNINAKNAASNSRKWFQYPMRIKNRHALIATAKILKNRFPFLRPNRPLYQPGFRAAVDLPEAPALADRGRGLYFEK